MMRVLVILLFLTASVTSTSNKFNYACTLKDKPEIGSTFPTIRLSELELQTSHRVTHQLATRVLAILLKEILTFQVNISDQLDRLDFSRSEKQIEYSTLMQMKINERPAINLEVWVAPDAHEIFPASIMQGGSLSNDLWKYSLAIMESFGEQTYSYRNFTFSPIDYFKTISDFRIDDGMRKVITDASAKINGKVYPCKSTSEPCATVITSHYNDTKFLINHVEKLGLKLEIYFLEDTLSLVLEKLKAIVAVELKRKKPFKKKFLVFHWTPSEILNGNTKFRPVAMPSCDLYKTDSSRCRYELTPVTTYFNQGARASEDLMEILQRLQFPSMQSLIDLYVAQMNEINTSYDTRSVNEIDLELYYNNVACEWLKQNKNVYTFDAPGSWIKKASGLMEISIGGIIPKIGTGREYDGITAAIDLALANANDASKNILPGYELLVKKSFTDCLPDLVLRHFINYYSHREHLIGVLGPSCTEGIEPMAAISKHFKMSVITYSAEGVSLSDREQFPYFFRTIGETSQFVDVFMKLLKALNWKRIAALTEDGTKYTRYVTDLSSRMKQNNMDFIVNEQFTRQSTQEAQFNSFMSNLEKLKNTHHAKLIIADVHDHQLLEQIMCAAKKSSMTASEGYVWFLPVYVSVKMNDTGFAYVNSTCSENEMREAIDGHIALSYSSFGDESDVIESGGTVGEWKQQYLMATNKNATHFNDYAGFTYDAIWVYVKALQELIKAGRDKNEYPYLRNLYSDRTIAKLESLISGMNFQGVSGRISFDKGSRLTDINILQWQKDDFTMVGTYKPKSGNDSNEGELSLNNQLSWVDNRKPEDGRESCALQGVADVFHVNCHTMITALVVILCFIIVLGCSALSFWFWKRKYDQKLDEKEKFLGNYRNILNGSELTKWEIPRENVVINRRLGEGAFGTVFGGEALIDDAWKPIAIKTLKPGSIAENRLDFLAESETMKRFDHKNIVKLLAVCLRTEPLYAIMEFMLYGDLKTYLLARRNFACEKMAEDPISPKNLTLMALDVARGLSYLAKMNYVHRDIACRNCLINSNNIVKIGDFGMARLTSESEYYRFARKGMLPVRWMAPESANDGVFSHASDIWSFGVLLYEIVSLGGFPYQGLTNNQVLENVKQGISIKIPTTGKPQLKALMSTCFSVDFKKRPSAATIVEFISNFPRMLTPCMDVPKPCLEDQVNLIDSDNDHLEQFENFIENRDRSQTPAHVDFLRTSASFSAIQNTNHHQDPSAFEYLDMKLSPKVPNGIYLNDFHPDLLPNGNYNPVEPLLQQTRPEISKSNLSLMKYVPMCGFGKNSNRSSPDECTSAV